jgi:hypothetical protein
MIILMKNEIKKIDIHINYFFDISVSFNRNRMETFSAIYDELCKNGGIEFTIYDVHKLSDEEVKKWSDKHDKYICIIEYQDKAMETEYFSSDWPNYKDILYSMVLDADAGNHKTFNDFCDEYGYDNDSIKALKTFGTCRNVRFKLFELFGENLFQRLLDCEKDL